MRLLRSRHRLQQRASGRERRVPRTPAKPATPPRSANRGGTVAPGGSRAGRSSTSSCSAVSQGGESPRDGAGPISTSLIAVTANCSMRFLHERNRARGCRTQSSCSARCCGSGSIATSLARQRLDRGRARLQTRLVVREHHRLAVGVARLVDDPVSHATRTSCCGRSPRLKYAAASASASATSSAPTRCSDSSRARSSVRPPVAGPAPRSSSSAAQHLARARRRGGVAPLAVVRPSSSASSWRSW